MKTKFLSLFVLLILGLFWANISTAQISVPGTPYSFYYSVKDAVQTITMPSIDVEKLKAEDAFESQFKDIPPRFGNPFFISYGMKNYGTMETMPDGSKIWRLTIKCPTAYAVNLIFDRFYLPSGSSMFVYNKNTNFVLGAFTSINNRAERVFSTAPVKGDEITIEYNAPGYINEPPEINVSTVVHVYKDLFKILKDYGQSGTCNRNVVCPEGDPYRNQIRSGVMLLTSSNSRFCSGSMLNNTRYDGTPYMLTANHCWDASSNTWIVMFNYQSALCANMSGDGPTNMTISGSTLMAKNAASDFCLIKLSSRPPTNYNVYYSGWNRSNVPATGGFCVHHPNVDVKKISFSTTPYTPTSYNSPTVPGDSSHWHVTWALIASTGVTPITEPGSSGSPIFDQNKRVVGQLHGGPSTCTATDKSDYYGKLDRSWNGGGTSATRLRDWLDSANTGVMFIDGFDPSAGPLNAYNLQTPVASVTITSIAGSSTPVSFTWDTSTAAATYKWIYGTSLPTRQLTLPATTNALTITLGQLDTYLAGLGLAQGDSVTGGWDVWAFRNNPPNNDSLKATNGPRAIKFKRYRPTLSPFTLVTPPSGTTIVTAPGGSTPVSITWNRAGQGLTYKWLYKTGGSYTDPATLRLASNNSGADTVLSLTTGQIDAYLVGLGLNPGDSITGYWRVRAYISNDSLNSTAPDRQITLRRAFIIPNIICRTVNIPISDNTTVYDSFRVGTHNTITDAQVLIGNITHTWDGDLTISLISPAGTTVQLFNRRGSSGDNIINCLFADTAATQITNGTPPFTGSFKPEQPLSALNGQDPYGTWKLSINDAAAGDVGTLTNWCAYLTCGGTLTDLLNNNILPTQFELSQNYPNPFNPVTKINFAIPKQGLVTLKIYDMLGREINTLVNEVKNPGYYSVDFNGLNLASGVYIYRLQVNEFTSVKRMILIK